MKIKTGIFLYASFLFIFLLFPYKTFAAAPSTGLVGDWDPALIVGLNDGDAVDTLPDAVAAKNATSVGTARPLYKTSIASYPVLLFDGTNDYVQTPSMSAVNQPYTIFIVFKPLRWQATDRIIDGRTVNQSVLNQYPNLSNHPYSLYAGSAFTVTNYGSTIVDSGSTFSIVRAKFNGASSELTLNRNTSGTGNPGANTFTGLTIGGAGNASLFSNLYLARILVYNSGLVSASDVEDYLAAQYSTLSFSSIPSLVIADGDSLTYGTGASVLAESYPSQLSTLLSSSWTLQNLGVSGQTIVNMESDAATQIDTQQINPGSTKDVLVAWGGTNDLIFGDSATTVYNNIVTYCQHRQAAGWKVIVSTILPRSHAGTPGTFEADRQTINANIRAHWRTFADGLVDVAADSRIGDAGDETDTTYYSGDNVHLNDAGYTIVANAVKNQIEILTDTTAPTVSLTAPSDNVAVSGNSVTIAANASDSDSGIAGVQFKLDTNTTIGSEDTTSPYGITWDSTAVDDGLHTLSAVARDNAGNVATSSSVTVTVHNAVPVSVSSNWGFSVVYPTAPTGVFTTTSTPSTPPQINTFAPIVPNSYKFYKNLSYDMTHADVLQLQKYLNTHGFVIAQSGTGSIDKETNYFGSLTYKTLIKFQEAHASDILTPSGLKKGTGYFGPSTRAFVNK